MTSTTVIQCLSSLFSLVGLPEYVHSDRGRSFLSRDVTEFLARRGVANSNSTPYHPTGNAQRERINQTLWKTIKLLLASQKLPEAAWEIVLPDALHNVRSLLCTSTNSTPHERLFGFQRRSMLGQSLPDWLLSRGSVLLRKFVRTKTEPLCDVVDLLDANSKYALVRHSDGRQTTVSVKDLAPCPDQSKAKPTETPNDLNDADLPEAQDELNSTSDENSETPVEDTESPQLRRSGRIRKSPDWYGDRIS
ncbi:uncharacterized protein LOC144423026 [Styela clava]